MAYEYQPENARRAGGKQSFYFLWHEDYMVDGRYCKLSLAAKGLLLMLKIWAQNNGQLVDKAERPYTQEELASLCGTTRRKMTPIIVELEKIGAIGYIDKNEKRPTVIVKRFHYDQNDRARAGRISGTTEVVMPQTGEIVTVRKSALKKVEAKI